MENLLSYLLRRLLWVPPILVIVTFVTFVMARLGPGDPVRILAGQVRDEEAFARIRQARGLDEPIYQQYVIYMKGVLTRGDFGESFTQYRGRKVSEIIFPAFWRSMQYNAVALGATLTLGLAFGVYVAKYQGTWRDPTIVSSLLLLDSIPGAVAVPALLWFFAVELGWLPARGWPQDCVVTLRFLGESYECIGVFSKEAVVPLLILSVGGLSVWARFTRAFTLDVMKEDYIRTARSKGISEFTVMTRHVLRNALLPLSTMIGFALAGILGGSFILETIAGIPGIGRLAFQSIGSRDYDLIMALTIVGASVFLTTVILIDIGYTLIDPRVRLGARRS